MKMPTVAKTVRAEVETHPLIEAVFDYARLCPGPGNTVFHVAYFEEMPKLMQCICEACGEPQGMSASGVYYWLRNRRESTAVDCIATKEHKVVTLSRLMTVMAEHGMLTGERHQDGARHYVVYSTTPPFQCISVPESK
jgi:hypothetical protein